MLTVVVEVEVMQVSCVEAPTVNANHELGGIGWLDVVAEAPSAQYAVLVAPALLTTTTVPAGNVPVTPPVVTAIGVPVEAAVKPEIDADTEALTHALPVGNSVMGLVDPKVYASPTPVVQSTTTVPVLCACAAKGRKENISRRRPASLSRDDIGTLQLIVVYHSWRALAAPNIT